MFWIFFSVLMKAPGSFEMSPTTHSTTKHYIQEPHNCKTSSPNHPNIHNSVFLIATGSTPDPVSLMNLRNIMPFCSHFSPHSPQQLTFCADCCWYFTLTTSMPLSSSVSSLSLLDDSQSSCRSGADGPSSFV